MNTVVTSKEAILQTCRKIVSENGLSALNMRTVAQQCNVALGSLYNYFPSKEDLVLAAIESVWKDIFHMEGPCETDVNFPEYVRWMFKSVQSGAKEYPNFFTAHSLSFASSEKGKAREMMEHYFGHMKTGMKNALELDSAKRSDAFSAYFPESEFVDFVFSNLLMLLVQQKEDCNTLIEIIRRTLY